MALAAINVKKPREAQIWNYCTGNLVLRILPDSNKKQPYNTSLTPYPLFNRTHRQVGCTFSPAKQIKNLMPN